MGANLKEGPGAWLIRKDGYFYRPDCSGYTTRKDEAGRYTEAEAKREASVEPWHMSAILADDVPDPPYVADKRDAEIRRLSEEVERLQSGNGDELAERAKAALEVAHQACFKHPDRGPIGMSRGPFSGVNEVLGIVAQLRASWRSAAVCAGVAEREVERLKEQLGLTRMCVNCGKTVDAEKVKRGSDMPECVGPEGLSACTFDLTPREAWQHWRGVAHQLRGDVARLAKDLRAARNAALDEAARFVEEHNILHTSAGDVLEPRREGNRSGLAFASGIRSLKTEEPPQ